MWSKTVSGKSLCSVHHVSLTWWNNRNAILRPFICIWNRQISQHWWSWTSLFQVDQKCVLFFILFHNKALWHAVILICCLWLFTHLTIYVLIPVIVCAKSLNNDALGTVILMPWNISWLHFNEFLEPCIILRFFHYCLDNIIRDLKTIKLFTL